MAGTRGIGIVVVIGSAGGREFGSSFSWIGIVVGAGGCSFTIPDCGSAGGVSTCISETVVRGDAGNKSCKSGLFLGSFFRVRVLR